MLTVRRHPIRSSSDARRCYDELFQQDPAWLRQRDPLSRWVVARLAPRPGTRLLDIGCGRGSLLPAVRSAGLSPFGIDISEIGVRLARRALGDEPLVAGDGEGLPFPSFTFDYVTNIGGLEHFVNPEQGVREMARVLKGDGVACVLVPNAFGLTWNAWQVWRTGRLADDGYQPIQRYATRQAWQTLLEENGLAIRQVIGYEQAWPRTRDEWRPYLRDLKELAWLALSPLVPTNLARCFVFFAERASRGGPA